MGAARSRAGRQADLASLVLEDEAVRVEVDSPIDVAVVVDALAGRLLAVARRRERRARAKNPGEAPRARERIVRGGGDVVGIGTTGADGVCGGEEDRGRRCLPKKREGSGVA